METKHFYAQEKTEVLLVQYVASIHAPPAAPRSLVTAQHNAEAKAMGRQNLGQKREKSQTTDADDTHSDGHQPTKVEKEKFPRPRLRGVVRILGVVQSRLGGSRQPDPVIRHGPGISK